MRTVVRTLFALVFCASFAQAQNAAYPSMASMDQYLMDEQAEISLARSAAPAAIADHADVMVLRRDGYATVAKGTNGFTCMVVRSWANPTDDHEFWNQKVRSPNCFNAAATRSLLPIYLFKTKLVLAGKSPQEVGKAVADGFAKHRLPALEPGSMCYMMSKQQYLNDRDHSWHPHVMVFVEGDATKSWGADVPTSPVIAANDPEQRISIMMFLVDNWSDGSPAPQHNH